MDKTAERILEWFERHREEMKEFLIELVRTESPSRQPEAQKRLMARLIEKLHSLDYQAFRMPGRSTGGFLYARPDSRKKGKPCQLLVGHCDTVWPLGTLDEMPVVEQDGKLRGPGVFDMKAGLTQMLFAVEALGDLGYDPALTPLLLINSDEEIGSPESTGAIRRLARISDRAFIMEPPLDRDGKLKTARKGLGKFVITVTGKAAHAGLEPGKGASAIVELSHQIQKLFAMSDPEKGITVNVGMIEGGVSPNVVAPQSRAVVDVRVLKTEDAQRVCRQIEQLQTADPNTRLSVEGGMGRPPMEPTPRNRRLWQLAREKGRLMGLELKEATAGGGSDGNTTSQHTSTLDGLGTTGGGAHAAHEFIFLDKLVERAALLTLLLLGE